MYSYTLIFHYPNVPLPILTVASSFVQDVQNVGRRIAAAINSGSSVMGPKRFFIPIYIRNQKQFYFHVGFHPLGICLAHWSMTVNKYVWNDILQYTCKVSTRGLQYFTVNLIRSSLVVNRVTVGSSHPICTFSSACKMFVAWATGHMTAAYSVRKASSAGLNL